MAKSTVTSGASHEPGREPDGWPVPAEPDPEAPAARPEHDVAPPDAVPPAPAPEPAPAPVKPAKPSPSLSEPKAGITGSGGVTVPKAGAGGA